MLTSRRLEALAEGEEAADSLVKGLRVRKQGARRILFLRYRAPLTGRLRKLDLGDWGVISLEEARERAREKRDLLRAGIDPHEHKAAELAAKRARAAATFTVERLAEDFLEAEARRLAVATLAEYKRGLARIGELLGGEREAGAVTRGEALGVLDSVERDHGLRAAGHLLAAGRAAWQWALDRERVPANPWARHKAARRYVAEVRDRALDDGELRVFLANVDAALPADYAAAARLVLLTACRPGEACGAAYAEFDAQRWHIPAERHKARRGHNVPMFPALAAHLEAIRSRRGPGRPKQLFPAENEQGHLDVSALGHGLAVAASREDAARTLPRCTPHDLRRSVATGLQRLGVAKDVIEALLGHATEAGKASRHYLHHAYTDEMRAALERWAAHCEALRGEGRP
jgi:integrase